MANQGSQFRFNGDGAPSGNAASPRSLVNALGNIGNGGQPDVDTLMSQYAAQNNNDPEALVRARWQRLHACATPGRSRILLLRGSGRVRCAQCAAPPRCTAAARRQRARSGRAGAGSARGSCWRDCPPGHNCATCRRALRPRKRGSLLARAAARSLRPFAP